MEINDIINDAVHYPLSDYKKFLILGLPNLIISILFFVLILQALGLSSISDLPAKTIISSPIFSRFLLTTIIFFIALFLGLILISGIQLSVIRETIKGNNYLPNIEFAENFVDGLKCFILSIVYILLPAIIYMILVFFSIIILKDYAGFIIILLSILLIIATIFLSLLFMVSLCRLSETDSLGEALNIGNIYDIAKNIGLGKIFLIIVISGLMNIIISMIGTVLGYIPIIGFFILTYVLYTYYLLFSSRCCGLMYRDQNKNTLNYNGNFNQGPMNNSPAVNQEYENNRIENQNNNMAQPSYDYHPSQEAGDNNQNNSMPTSKTCSQCGHSNPGFANVCSNCGYRFNNGNLNQGPLNNSQVINKEIDNNVEKSDNDMGQTGSDYQPSQESGDNNQNNSMPTPKTCSQCGHSNPEYANVCSNCGNRL